MWKVDVATETSPSGLRTTVLNYGFLDKREERWVDRSSPNMSIKPGTPPPKPPPFWGLMTQLQSYFETPAHWLEEVNLATSSWKLLN